MMGAFLLYRKYPMMGVFLLYGKSVITPRRRCMFTCDVT